MTFETRIRAARILFVSLTAFFAIYTIGAFFNDEKSTAVFIAILLAFYAGVGQITTWKPIQK